MANEIKDYNRNYRRTDLSDVGAKIQNLSTASDSTMIQELIGMGLQIAQNAYLDKKSESRQDFNTAMTSTSNALKVLDHTQSGIELIDDQGNVYDAYDKQYEIAKEALENLSEFQDDPALKKQRPEINRILNEFTQILAHKDSMKNQREGYLDNLEDLGNNYMNLVKADPSMTDPDDWKAATEIIKDLELGYANLLANSGKKIPAAKSMEYADLLQTNELLLRAREGDLQDKVEGFQTDLSAKGSPYLQAFFEKIGMKQVSVEDGIATYMPELADPQIAGVQEYEAPDTEMYKEANDAFNKWQSIQTDLEVKNLIYEQTAEERRPLEIMRDWMEAPGDIAQAKGADVIAFQLFGDTDKTFEQNISDIEDGPYKDNLFAKYNQLSELKAEGKHAAAFASMQTTYNKKQKAVSKLKGLTIGEIDDVFASAIRTTSSATNDALTTYNNQFDKDDPRRIIDVSEFAEKTLGATTKESKVQHIDSMNKLLKRANAGEWTAGNEPGGEIRLIRDYETAEGEAKWIAIQKLVDTYLTPAGTRENEDEIIAAFDADYMGGTREENEVEVFYALLRSWQAISNADPEGTTPLSLLDLLSK